MKKIFYVCALFGALCVTSCGNNCKSNTDSTDTIDTVNVDTVDSVVTDSVCTL